MAISGDDVSVTIGSTTFTKADCLQDINYNYSVDTHNYQCGNFNHILPGAKNASCDLTLAIDATDTALLGELAPGTAITTFELHPGGDTATYIEITSTDGYVVDRPMTIPLNGVVMITVNITLNNVTEGVAT